MKIILADSIFKRFKGLMFKKDFDECMLFCNLKDSSIHTLFMKFEIDIYFLDSDKVIIEKTSLKPWKVYRPKKSAKYILETRKNRLNLRVNDELELI